MLGNESTCSSPVWSHILSSPRMSRWLLLLACLIINLPLSALGLDNGLGLRPPMGWNTWNHFGCRIDEFMVRQSAEALVSTGLAAVGYKYVNLDDCWAELRRSAEGELVARNTTFPSGIKALADFVHRKGLMLGIYSDAGFYTCQQQPGSLGFEKQDARTFASWGVDYLKYDNCFHDGRKPEVRYTIMRDALRKVGHPIYFSMCEWGVDNPALWASKIANSWRTTNDITDSWISMTAIADINDEWAPMAGPGGWNDPDMLEVGNGGMSTEEYRSHFSIWALMKAPLILGCDVRNMTKETLRIVSNTEVIAVNQDPLGIQGRKVSSKGPSNCEQIWAGPLSLGRTVVVAWNRCETNETIKISWEEISIRPSSQAVRIRDLWKHKYLEGVYRKGMEVLVGAHSAEMFVFTPVPPALTPAPPAFSSY